MPRAASLAIASLIALIAAPAPAAAQAAGPSAAEMRAQIERCLDAAADRAGEEACIGRTSGACMEAPGGQTTVGMAGCLGAETEAWDSLLNALWPRLKADAAESDAAESPQAAGLPTRADSLLAAQRAWIAFRDAECLHAYAQGGMGTIRTLYGASCQLEETAERALEFRAWLRAPP
ncbi:lysozyme inhibitor LprI family protein [Albimonas pacifica]|uniref:Lysozyme inhibitor LprI-like N-terminal domain-containing protein n=1 Tax=Albimonas pacifica TaxID=1114924 RepID=A0A1I3FKB0_9RHOB|nr:lysozyme inhibitor LprI family protein [Albimonas pacifica]SFI11606.1 Protein of unknown function [Albimonas pacifica]